MINGFIMKMISRLIDMVNSHSDLVAQSQHEDALGDIRHYIYVIYCDILTTLNVIICHVYENQVKHKGDTKTGHKCDETPVGAVQ